MAYHEYNVFAYEPLYKPRTSRPLESTPQAVAYSDHVEQVVHVMVGSAHVKIPYELVLSGSAERYEMVRVRCGSNDIEERKELDMCSKYLYEKQ